MTQVEKFWEENKMDFPVTVGIGYIKTKNNKLTYNQMTKTVTHINCPKEWESENDWDSHRPALWIAFKYTNYNVVELGSGFGSTPLLRLACSISGREFISYETNKDWAEKTGSIFTDTYFHELGKIDLLFIDAAPGEQRKDLIELHKDNADVIVIHDTEEGAQNIYGIREILNSFKYRLNYYPKGNPGTTALSNKIDVTTWI